MAAVVSIPIKGLGMVLFEWLQTNLDFMKRLAIIFGLSSGMIAYSSCNQADGSIDAIDLESGETITVVKDTATGKMVNKETGQTAHLFVNTKTKDTVYGETGEVVNNQLQLNSGKYVYYSSEELKMKSEQGGDYKIKYGDDYKEKHENGEYKIKHGDYKEKVDSDGDVKIKNGDQKIKIDGETGEVKVKN